MTIYEMIDSFGFFGVIGSDFSLEVDGTLLVCLWGMERYDQ